MDSPLVSFIIFFFALGGMIFVHEFGHFLAARWAGIEVEEFGFGLPSKKLFTLFTWQGTEFTVHALPLGGFVRPKGENDPNIPGGLASASPWKRLVVLFAGPLMNLLTAIVVFSLLIALEGMPILGVVNVTQVEENSPAAQAGIQAGDRLLAINGEAVESPTAAVAFIKENWDKPVSLTLERNEEKMTITATPLSSRAKEVDADGKAKGALGIGLSAPTRPATALEVIGGGATITALNAVMIVYIPIGLIQGVIAPEEARVVGFKGMLDMFNGAVQEDAASRKEAAAAAVTQSPVPPVTNYTLSLIGMLSVSLGVMNLLPIPALDGGRILFTLPEILFRRRIPPERENLINGVAMLLLIGLLLFVNLMDFINPAKIPF